ncbi:MAG: hypothetical protein REI11_14665 [Patulibacter sp.]|nr:hypothetical protein [Patulibacter sp.]
MSGETTIESSGDLASRSVGRWLTRCTSASICMATVAALILGAAVAPDALAVQYDGFALALAAVVLFLPRGRGVVADPSWGRIGWHELRRAPLDVRTGDRRAGLGLSAVMVAAVVVETFCAASGDVASGRTVFHGLAYGLLVWFVIAAAARVLRWQRHPVTEPELGQWLPSPWERRASTKVSRFDHDLGTWPHARAFAIHAHTGWAWMAITIGHAFTMTVLPHGDEANTWDASFVLVVLIWGLVWLRRGGWVTIDPHARTLSWGRPPRSLVPARTWRFDELRAVELGRGAAPTSVRLDLGDRRIRLRLPAGEARRLARSLREAAGLPATRAPW